MHANPQEHDDDIAHDIARAEGEGLPPLPERERIEIAGERIPQAVIDDLGTVQTPNDKEYCLLTASS